ncbi:phage tail sheath C-terminal domain-containing protein [Bacillus sp. AK031]
MGLPEINITFTGKAQTLVQRSQLGIVALILKDDTGEFDSIEYKNPEEVETSDWTTENADYIANAFKGDPSKVIVERLETTAVDYSAALSRLRNKRFNYLAVPAIESADVPVIAEWVISNRTDNKKTFKAVLPNAAEDHEAIINFTTNDIKVGEKVYDTAEFTSRIAGILAGLPFTRSATYFVLDEVDSITEIEDPNAAVDAGELILINDGEKIKVGRGVNSLVTITPGGTKNDEFKSIRVIEAMDMIHDDIYSTFDDEYVGKVNNIYDNQVIFINSVNRYFARLQTDEILDPNATNQTRIDTPAQRSAWEDAGFDTTDWDEQRVKETSFRKSVFLAGNIKIVDTMEDLDFSIAI